MFRKTRRPDRALTYEETEKIMKETAYGVLTTIGEDGYPYGVPVNYSYEDDKIYFHGTCLTSHKNDNMDYSSKVSFTIVSKAELLPDKFSCDYESAIAFGHVRKLDGEEKEKAFIKIIEKYEKNFMDIGREKIKKGMQITGVFAIDVELLTGKKRK